MHVHIYIYTQSYFLSMAVYLLRFLQYIFKTSFKKFWNNSHLLSYRELMHSEIKWIPEDHSGNLHWSKNLHFSYSCWAPEEEAGVPSGPGALQHCHRHWENKAKGGKHWTWHKEWLDLFYFFFLLLFYVCPSACSESKISYSGPAFS